MHRLVFGHSFVELVAPILLLGLAFFFLNKKKASVHENAEDSDTTASGSLIVPMGTNSDESSSTPIETNSGESSSLTELSGNCYDVFLSFRGKDTRKSFADHLYYGLVDAGIPTFRDNNDLRRGKKIGPDLFAAIENSKILIPILSLNYGTSSWCLNELVRIMECKNKTGHIVLPIFYKVEPSDVRHQSGSFGDAFHRREMRLIERHFDPMKLDEWKRALNDVSSLKGWTVTRAEGELVRLVLQEVLSELIKKFDLDIPDNLTGIDSQVEKVTKFVKNNSHAPLFVGIHGMGGIGKTTVAKTIYNELSNNFEYRSFIANIKEKYKYGVEHLQNQLIYDILKKKDLVGNKDAGIKFLSSNFKNKKVLILLDDVDSDDHLQDLARSHDWFSSGSVIIITTRDERILDGACVDRKHNHKELDMDNSLILFSRYAFQKDAPSSEFEKLADEVVSTTGGLPLSLKVLGSLLRNKKREVWEETIKMSRKVPEMTVQDTLKISYDALASAEQQIFLDIACFFIGTDWRTASYMWDACEFYPMRGIVILRSMSLIEVVENHELRMHDQLRDLGREIVRKEDKEEPQNRSRLWDFKEVLKMLEEDEGTRKIVALSLGKHGKGRRYTAKQFKKMTNLRFLLANGSNFTGDFQSLLPKLRWLQWAGCPSDFIVVNFRPKKLVVLDLSHSAISEDWGGWVPLKMATKLKVLNLGNCPSLRRTPDLSDFKSLEILILKYCRYLEEIHPSIGDIKTLISLDVSHCKRLKELPAGIVRMVELRELRINDTDIQEIPISRGCLMKLETLCASNCRRLSQLPELTGSLVSLTLLDLSGSAIEGLPESIGSMKELKTLEASLCGRLACIPSSIGDLASLQSLSLSTCSLLTEIPNSIGKLVSLTELDLGDTRITKLPESIGNMPNLRILRINGTNISELPNAIGKLAKLQKLKAEECKKLERLPDNICELVSLEELYLDKSGISDLPKSISKLSSLQELSVGYCEKLRELPELPSSLTHLSISCQSPRLPSLSQLSHLEALTFFNCPWLERVPELPIGLSTLFIVDCKKLKAFTNLSNSKPLSYLCLDKCFNLTEVNGVEGSYCLSNLFAGECPEISRVDWIEDSSKLMSPAASQRDGSLDLPNSKILQGTDAAASCVNSVEIQNLGGSNSSQVSDVFKCTSAGGILDFSSFKYVISLYIWNCENVTEIQGLDGSECLTYLEIQWCSSLRSVDLSNLKNLRGFLSSRCKNLVEIRGLEGLGPPLRSFRISGCPSLRQSPDLLRLQALSTEE